MNAESTVVSARDLVTGYSRGRVVTPVTRASFTIDPGAIVALVGPNGAGKSTLLKTLVGLLPPLSGHLTVAGYPPAEHRRRAGIGYLPEGVTLPDAWSSRGLLALMTFSAAGHAARDLPTALRLATVDFDLDKPVADLSKGMRQRLALALALTPLPGLLLLDEPEAGLDPAQRILLRKNIREFASDGRIVVVASHDITGLCLTADQTYLMAGQEMRRLDQAELSDPATVLQLFEQVR